ncbi:hypothetical protein [Aquimarina sp. RZ0]|uniref:hypothetical protein n=1 Tax=Aquimarina sp. RZ0 TaxID=2607730 RepID=UPI0011F327F6|nr:hypothetical protein [Aquimarina sp. RZ0]KAA1241562.1 hypothetical protein F0000_26475 [Aquimarina sp. RZ0]
MVSEDFNLYFNKYVKSFSRIRATTLEANLGTHIIAKFDQENGIIAGTFEFTVLDTDGNEIKITDGRFDLLYTN